MPDHTSQLTDAQIDSDLSYRLGQIMLASLVAQHGADRARALVRAATEPTLPNTVERAESDAAYAVLSGAQEPERAKAIRPARVKSGIAKQQVLAMRAEGMRPREIAEKLGISRQRVYNLVPASAPATLEMEHVA